MHPTAHSAVRRMLSVLTALWILPCLMFSVSASMPQGFTIHRQSIISEPNQNSKYMQYYENGSQLSTSKMNWVTDEERDGKVLSLSGHNAFVQLTSEPLPLMKATLTAWVNWEQTDTTSPVLFSWTSDVIGDYLTLSLHHTDADKQIDGVYLHLWHDDGSLEREWFVPVSAGMSAGIPQNEWHHIAFTTNGQWFRLYVDGERLIDEMMIFALTELRANRLYIGSPDPDITQETLKAKLDNVYLYDKAMSRAQVQIEMQTGVNPFSDAASTATTTTTAPYYPTEPSTTTATTVTTTTVASVPMGPKVVAGLPVAVWGIMGGIVVVFVGLSIAMNIHPPKGGNRR